MDTGKVKKFNLNVKRQQVNVCCHLFRAILHVWTRVGELDTQAIFFFLKLRKFGGEEFPLSTNVKKFGN